MNYENKALLKKSARKQKADENAAVKKPISTQKLRNRLIIIFACVAVILTVAVLLLFNRNSFISTPNRLTITVAWNPGSTADDVVRVLMREMNTSVTIQNITGANGASAANTVYSLPHSGGNLLSTNLSAFVTSEAMGFADSSHRDWDVWLCAFAPAVLVVTNDSPYNTVGELIRAIREYPGAVRCADEGYGTVSYIAAELFSSQIVLELSHQSFSGSNQTIDALLDYNADFAILLSSQVIEHLHSGRLKALGVFNKNDFELSDNKIIPPVSNTGDRLSEYLPFGEYYGLFIPSGTPEIQLSGFDRLIKDAVNTESFNEFIQKTGLESVTPDRKQNAALTERFCSITNWTLFNAGFLPTNPDTLGIPKP
ncbi:MAG: tripartite tricarboxylate transporter substrate-binding protein [Oscillospiraceae bacterium]|nr:tripartite tricarboxylate transporter substrate-binding protein [Oscillospiraceae bacterium]